MWDKETPGTTAEGCAPIIASHSEGGGVEKLP